MTTTPLLKHTDDDGDLSVFASGDQLLFTCSNGHFWVVKVIEYAADPVSPLPEQVDAISTRFGPATLEAMGLD